MVRIIAVLGIFLIPHGGFAQVLDPPIGFLEIKDGPDGKITVHARCVRGQDLLDELAKRAGFTLQAERPVQCYVSIDPTSANARYWSVRKWLQFAAEECGLRFDGEDDKRTATLTQSDYYYDPFLTEDEVVAKYRTSLEPVTPEKGITNGLVILEGHLIRPPYEVAWNKINECDAQITVNKLPLFKVYGPKAAKPTPVPELPETGQFSTLSDLCLYVSMKLYPTLLEESGRDPVKAKKAALAFVQGQDITKGMDVVDRDGYPSLRSSEYSFSDIFLEGYNFETGKPFVRRVEIPSLERAVSDEITPIENQLAAGNLLSGFRTKWPHFAAKNDADLISILPELPKATVLQRECLLQDGFGYSKPDARMAACNLMDDDYAFMIKRAGRCMDADRR